MKFLFLFFFINLIILEANAIECDWWQTKISAHSVRTHERNGSEISEHNRKEHCREKWKGADNHIKQFNNDAVTDWETNEKFKKWTNEEIQTLLKILATIPDWAQKEKYKFHRAINSTHKNNPATNERLKKLIVFYDSFFNSKNKAEIFVHESSHFLYDNLSPTELKDFLDSSGWTLEFSKDRKIYEIPPKKLILPDSNHSKDEDFANHVESYYKNPKKYQKSYPKLFDFFHKRYPL